MVVYGWRKTYEKKDKEFNGFTLDKTLLDKAEKNAIVLHCLPAYRSKEITDEVMESKNSRIFDQAENRMHVQQALLYFLLNWVIKLFFKIKIPHFQFKKLFLIFDL